jgi:hypothetical protein
MLNELIPLLLSKCGTETFLEVPDSELPRCAASKTRFTTMSTDCLVTVGSTMEADFSNSFSLRSLDFQTNALSINCPWSEVVAIASPILKTTLMAILCELFAKMQLFLSIFSFISLNIFATPNFAQASVSATAPSPQASAACLEISTGSAETGIWPAGLTNPDYEDAKNHYYSAANADLTPACAVFPTSAVEVSYIVKVLLKYPTVPYAVKGWGHNPNVGFLSTNWGVLITFSKDAATNISSDHSTADIGPGARWGEVIGNLTTYNVAVVGGRLGESIPFNLYYDSLQHSPGDVGVAGLLLGGGLSFLSAQYGLACDNVVSYEVVLADGSIVNANANSYTDLFWALKGGGNQFGMSKFVILNTRS